MKKQADNKQTTLTWDRYQRISQVYDLMEIIPERRYSSWRERLWSLVRGPEVLEVGVGTGKNLAFYPDGVRVTGVDLASGMLERARKRAVILNMDVTLILGDAQNLEFPDSSFDTVVATFVFCSVSDPVQGLRELGRVVRPDGQILLMEHVRSDKPLVGDLMDVLNPALVRVTGANINRRTVENIRRSGLQIERVEDLGIGDIFKLIIARRK
jgi:ubiquinone/menaquinone biosynthesis C-methylase UbiE